MNSHIDVRKVRRARPLVTLCALVAGLCAAASANATLVYNSTIGGAATGSTRENFDGLTPCISTNPPADPACGGGTHSGITVSFSPSGGVVQGTHSGAYAAPYLTGNNGIGFGPGGTDQAIDSADATVYLTAGGTIASGDRSASNATLTMPGWEHYFGILWGSVDAYNTLTFYSGSTAVGSVTGSDIMLHASGDQGPGGTSYVNFNSSVAFDSVVMTSSSYAFEFDNVAFSSDPLNLPEPGALGMMGLGLLTMAGLAFRRRRRLGSND